jgi:hypothetical protein
VEQAVAALAEIVVLLLLFLLFLLLPFDGQDTVSELHLDVFPVQAGQYGSNFVGLLRFSNVHRRRRHGSSFLTPERFEQRVPERRGPEPPVEFIEQPLDLLTEA